MLSRPGKVRNGGEVRIGRESMALAKRRCRTQKQKRRSSPHSKGPANHFSVLYSTVLVCDGDGGVAAGGWPSGRRCRPSIDSAANHISPKPKGANVICSGISTAS